MIKVHFICRGNSYRSIMAEAYLKSLMLEKVSVISSGTSADYYRSENEPRIPKLITFLSNKGVDQFAKTQPEQLTQTLIDSSDVNICMNKIVAYEAKKIVALPKNTHVWNIDDTGEGNNVIKPGDDPFKYTESIYYQIVDKIDQLAKDLT